MRKISLITICLLALVLASGPAWAMSYTLTVEGTDAIYLSGATGVTIPALGGSDPSFLLSRHGYVLGDFLQETFPDFLPVTDGESFQFSAEGSIHYYNGTGVGFGPDGESATTSNLASLYGISGYSGPAGALVGLFLDDSDPSFTPAPPTLDFLGGGLGTSFLSLAPELGQIFFIGDGFAGGDQQTFFAPVGATRLFLGIADGFGFNGNPGAYEDNDGSFRVKAEGTSPIPEPATLVLMVIGLLGVVGLRNHISK